jgi:hypothetical protein
MAGCCGVSKAATAPTPSKEVGSGFPFPFMAIGLSKSDSSEVSGNKQSCPNHHLGSPFNQIRDYRQRSACDQAACSIFRIRSFLCSSRSFIFKYRVASTQCSSISTTSARTSRKQLSALGKIRTTSVRRFLLDCGNTECNKNAGRVSGTAVNSVSPHGTEAYSGTRRKQKVLVLLQYAGIVVSQCPTRPEARQLSPTPSGITSQATPNPRAPLGSPCPLPFAVGEGALGRKQHCKTPCCPH